MPRTLMIPHRLLLLCLLSVSLATLPRAGLASELRRSAIVRAVESADPSVVNIHGRKTVRAEAGQLAVGESFRQVNGMGTGVVIDERGYIITNYHVVEGVGRIQVTLHDGTTTLAQLVSHDPRTDLAIIKVQSTYPLPVIKIGTSSDLQRGETVIAVGNAYGYDHTVTRGIISALDRPVQVSDKQRYEGLIQTDASINPGNSGGPLLNIDGDMVGINVAVRVGAQGIGFAIPVDEAMNVAARLLSVERIESHTHGARLETEIDDAVSRVRVTSVSSGSPAAAAGLQAGDEIVRVGNISVERNVDFERALLGRQLGKPVDLAVRRGDEVTTLSLNLQRASSRPSPRTADIVWQHLGLRLTPVSDQVFRQFRSRYRGGLKVTSTRPDGPGAQEGIRAGDVLVGLHKWQTISLDNVAYVVNSEELDPSQPIKFYVLRGGETLYGHLEIAR